MLGSNLSAVAGDGDMGGIRSQLRIPPLHVSVHNAINPGGLGAGPQIKIGQHSLSNLCI